MFGRVIGFHLNAASKYVYEVTRRIALVGDDCTVLVSCEHGACAALPWGPVHMDPMGSGYAMWALCEHGFSFEGSDKNEGHCGHWLASDFPVPPALPLFPSFHPLSSFSSCRGGKRSPVRPREINLRAGVYALRSFSCPLPTLGTKPPEWILF